MYQENWKQGSYGIWIGFGACLVFVFAFGWYDYIKANPRACHDPVSIIEQDAQHNYCPGNSHLIIVENEHVAKLACKCNEQ